MKILLITSSARGHAIADALSRSPQHPEIIHVCTSRNPGIRRLAKEQHIVDSLMDFDAIVKIAQSSQPDFAIIGPEDPICGGLVDQLEAIGVPSVAPKKSGARIEGSKGFTRDLLEKYAIDANPKFRVFSSSERNNLNNYIVQELGGDYVVKYDALKGGKGVKVSGDHLHSVEEGVAYAEECIDECGSVVIEEKLVGCEFSLISFVSGSHVVDTPAVQDHKRAFEGDTGPNTGGMGTYSDANHSLPFLDEADIERASEINRQVAEALMKECGEPYKGILYGGFIASKRGVQLIEYNCRFGDPEALNILPLLSSDFVAICQGIINGDLSEDLVTFEKKATVCKYIVPEGYPENKNQRNEVIQVVPAASRRNANVQIFFGDISEDDSGTLHLGGSRTAGIVGIGSTISEAEAAAQAACEAVEGPVRFRSDIGTEELIQHRIDLMQSLRS